MENVNNVIIYYFSGTGNARHVATWIARVATTRKMAAAVYNIAELDRRNVPPPPDALIGFCSPTHGFNFPPIMLGFLFRFPRGKNRVFIVNTRAGMKLGKVALPGLSGIAPLLSSLILLLKGYTIVGMRPIDLPSNWISLHPGLTRHAIDFLFLRCRDVTVRFAERIIAGKRDYRSLWDLPQDLLIAPVSVGYYCVGRFVFAKSFYASSSCDDCGVCIKECPVSAIRVIDGRPFWSHRCESCMRCMNSCPKRAVETAHGYVIGMILLLAMAIQPFVYQWLSLHGIGWFEEDAGYGFFTRFALNALITFAVMVGSYRLLHFLRRWKTVRSIIQYTSLTSFTFWSRYKPLQREMQAKGIL